MLRVWGWLALLLLLILGCSVESSGPELIHVANVTPERLESGDPLQISGTGFPEGAVARVAFRGDLLRAGQGAQHGIEIVAVTRDCSKNTITLALNDELEAAFCGTGDSSAHALFQGSITVSFAGAGNFGAPVRGSLSSVRIDVRPRPRTADALLRRRQAGQQALAFLGIELKDDGPQECCFVQSTSGRAQLSGIRPGDRLLAFDGLPVHEASDLVASGRSRLATVSVGRDDLAPPVQRRIDVQGFRWALPSELSPAFGLLIFVIGCLGWAASPLGTFFGSLVRRLNRENVGLRREAARPLFSRIAEKSRRLVHDVPLPDSAGGSVFRLSAAVAVGALAAAIALRHELIEADLDLVLWWLTASAFIAMATFLYTTAPVPRITGRLKAASVVIVDQIPFLLLIVTIMVLVRSGRMADIVQQQGFWPNEWLLIHDPALISLAFAATVGLSFTPGLSQTWTPAVPKQEGTALAARGGALTNFFVAHAHLWLQSVLLSVLLLGGWAVPASSFGMSHHPSLWRALGALSLLLKSSAVVAAVTLMRTLIGSEASRHGAPLIRKYVLPLSVLSAALSIGWGIIICRWDIAWLNKTMHYCVLAWLCTAAAWSFARLRRSAPEVAPATLHRNWL